MCDNTQEQTVYEYHGHELRDKLKAVAAECKEFVQTSKDYSPAGGDDSKQQNQSEMIANAILSYRHLEDAAMRIGKCLQAYRGGVSILDKMSPEERQKISNR